MTPPTTPSYTPPTTPPYVPPGSNPYVPPPYTPPGNGVPGTPAAGGGIQNYGINQVLNGFGIPGFENGPMYGGGSWAGTVWNPAQRGSWVSAAIEPSPVNGGNAGFSADTGGAPGINQNPWLATPFPSSQAPGGNAWAATQAPIIAQQQAAAQAAAQQQAAINYLAQREGRRTALDNDPSGTQNAQPSTPTDQTATQQTAATTEAGTPAFGIRPATPYQTTWYQSTYGGTPTGGLRSAPWANIHEQTGAAMQGIAPAYPGFQWASPGALAQLGGYGLPAGWAAMLGFTPGGA